MSENLFGLTVATDKGLDDLHWLRMDMQVVSYIVMVEVLPFLGLGFIHRDGYPFEKLVKIYLV